MTDKLSGDPLVTLDQDGADLVFIGGNPVMDQGFLNHCNYALLTESGHWTEDFEPVSARRYKGLFLAASKKPITRQSLIDLARAAEADLAGDEFKSIRAEAINPTGYSVDVEISYQPPSTDRNVLRLTKAGQTWINQIDNPVNDYLNGDY